MIDNVLPPVKSSEFLPAYIDLIGAIIWAIHHVKPLISMGTSSPNHRGQRTWPQDSRHPSDPSQSSRPTKYICCQWGSNYRHDTLVADPRLKLQWF